MSSGDLGAGEWGEERRLRVRMAARGTEGSGSAVRTHQMEMAALVTPPLGLAEFIGDDLSSAMTTLGLYIWMAAML